MHFLICDDHPFVAQALAMSLEAAFGAQTTIVHRFEDAIAAAGESPAPALCLLDFHIPGEESAASLRRLRTAAPGARLLVFSGSEADADLRAALDAGVDGFLPKSSPPEIIEAAVRLVLAGGRYLPDRLASLAFGGETLPGGGGIRSTHQAMPAPGAQWSGALTERQRAVLAQVAEGHSNKEIARMLGISPATVKAHVAQIIGVLHASNRTEAVANARRVGLV